MRQLIVQVPRGQGARVVELAERLEGKNLARLESKGPGGPSELVFVHLSNRRVEALFEALEGVPDVRISFAPQGHLALHPPRQTSPEQVRNVELRSPVEVFLSALQSVGSWRGFLGYAFASGIIVWIGLYSNTLYLLTAAMLIAPYAGPAMTGGIATARGDLRLLGRSVLRYFASLAVAIATAALLSLVLGQKTASDLMVSISQVSSVAILLPITAGAAGALNLLQSERSSLVSGAGTGMLVAASLAPPAGIVGMSLVLGDWDMTKSALFLLVLQLAGINLASALVFRLHGLGPVGPRYERGRQGVFWAGITASALALGGLAFAQLRAAPGLQRSTLSSRAEADVVAALEDSGLAKLVEANVRFTRADIPGQNTLLAVVYAQPTPGAAGMSRAEIASRLEAAIEKRLASGYGATPVVSVTVVKPPPGS